MDRRRRCAELDALGVARVSLWSGRCGRRMIGLRGIVARAETTGPYASFTKHSMTRPTT